MRIAGQDNNELKQTQQQYNGNQQQYYVEPKKDSFGAVLLLF